MRYLLTITQTADDWRAMKGDPSKVRGAMEHLVATLAPEAFYASLIRRAAYIIVNVDDPHVKLRNMMELLEEMGTVSVEPISSLEEMKRFVGQL